MSSYDLLAGVTVVEVSQYGPDALGGFLADMGATVIKVEEPVRGDPIRFGSGVAAGGPDGFGLLHLRWNRGKKSVTVDMKTDSGKKTFGQLVGKAQIVIEGMRAGVLERMGLGYDVLRQSNPALVFCSVSGYGLSGPYHEMGSHGPSFDGFGGLVRAQSSAGSDEAPDIYGPRVAVGMYAMGLYAALGTVAALRKAERTGEGSLVEVAAADCAAHWIPTTVDAVLNEDLLHVRPGFAGSDGRMGRWPRLNTYLTSDKKVLMVQLLVDRYWSGLCRLVNRPDLATIYDGDRDVSEADETVCAELTKLFATKTRAEWMDLFLANDISAIPVNTYAEVASDPHFVARDNVYAPDGAGGLSLTGTPIRIHGQEFRPALAPGLGDDNVEILEGLVEAAGQVPVPGQQRVIA